MNKILKITAHFLLIGTPSSFPSSFSLSPSPSPTRPTYERFFLYPGGLTL
ncbi:rCG44605 [Rattus norvegicus]|uniref:RCG44605 n=1 Tax=Rattus norvegicus TaxID=10116 RepID=A6I4U3_RAT|nr:rCG44605 [Rattus norvegicus]